MKVTGVTKFIKDTKVAANMRLHGARGCKWPIGGALMPPGRTLRMIAFWRAG